MKKKRGLKRVLIITLIALILGSLLIFSNNANALNPDDTGLCLNPAQERFLCSPDPVKARECCDVSNINYDQCIQAYFRPGKTSSDSSLCNFGTCLFNCQSTYLFMCNDPSPPIDFVPPGVADDRALLCTQTGCCRMTLSNQQAQCFGSDTLPGGLITKNECDAKLQTQGVSKADFFLLPTGGSCNALCQGPLPTGTVTGIVKDESSGASIPGAAVEISDKTATTDSSGKFTIQNVPATDQIIKVSISNYDSVIKKITILKDKTITETFNLKRSTAGVLRGRVIDTQGKPLGGVVVSYVNKEAITNANGFYEISNIPVTENAVLRAVKPGYSTFENNNVGIPFETIFTFEDITLKQVSECRQNDRINTNSGDCKCGSVVFPNTDSGFCCIINGAPAYKTTSCQNLLKLGGTVTSQSGNLLTGVRITVKPQTGGSQFFDFTEAGKYDLSLPPGNYQIIAEDLSSNQKFQRFNSSIIVSAEEVFDIILVPSSDACDIGNITNVNVLKTNIRGKPDINISWQDPCSSKALQYLILDKSGLTIADIPNDKSSFILKKLEYNKNFTIIFRVAYTNNRFFNKQLVLDTGSSLCEGKTNTAQEFCTDKNFLQNGLGIYRSFCNENNKVRLISGGNCTKERTGSVCTGPDKNAKTFCAVASSCYLPNITNPFGLFFNKQSCLFANSADNVRNYCYYDVSNTIVDKCYSCSSISSCYDYKSQTACEENSCQFANNKCKWMPTQYTVFGKGYCYQENYTKTDKCLLCGPNSGLFINTQCTQEICSALGSCFSETKSKTKTNINFTQCTSCSQDTSCRTFKTKELCIGSSGLSKPQFSVPSGTSAEDTALLRNLYDYCESTPDIIKNQPLSQDACNLGKCNWNPDLFGASTSVTSVGSVTSGDFCFKDSNFDNSPDCTDTTGTCNFDNTAPVTHMNFPSIINRKNNSVIFTVSDQGSDNLGTQTKICFGNFCCPSALASPPDSEPFGNVKILRISGQNGTLFPGAKQGHNTIGFFSKDSRSNIESVQYKQIFIDTQPPLATITSEVKNSTEANSLLSELTVRVSLNEFAKCTARLEPEDKGFYTITQGIVNQSGTRFTASYKNVKDFTYAFIIICTDSSGNSNSISQGVQNIDVDRNRKILSAVPQNKKLAAGNVLVKLNITDRGQCSLTNLDNQEVISLDETGTSITGPFTFFHQFSNLQSKTYRYSANCVDVNNKPLDSALVSFTVDTLAPVTSVKVAKSGFLEPFNSSMPFPYQIADLVLQCNDPNITGLPGQFNCDSSLTKWCFTANAVIPCTPTIKFIKPLKREDLQASAGLSLTAPNAGVGKICFNSLDLGSNSEIVRCASLRADLVPPEIETVNVIGPKTQKVNNTFFRTANNKVNVTGIVNEDTKKAVVFVSVFYIDSRTRSLTLLKTTRANTTLATTLADEKSGGKILFNADVSLDVRSNENFRFYIINVKAFDFSSNTREKEVLLNFDNIGPSIIEFNPNPFTSNKAKPLIRINTSKTASCTLKYPIKGVSPSFQQNQSFLSTDGIVHTIIPLFELPSSEITRIGSILLFNCTDTLNGKSAVSSKQFIFDKENPTISSFDAFLQGVVVNSTENTKDYVMLSGLLASLRVNASEPIRCKYSQSSIDFNRMENVFNNFDKYNRTAETGLISNFASNKNFTFFIACQDAAGNNASLRTINIETRLNAPVFISEITPRNFVNSLRPKIRIITPFNVNCFASTTRSSDKGKVFVFDTLTSIFTDNQKIKLRKDKQNKVLIHATDISSISGRSQVLLEENKEYSYTILCEDPEKLFTPKELEILFTPDVTLPVINNFNPTSDLSTINPFLDVSGATEKFSEVKIIFNDELVGDPIVLRDKTNFGAKLSLITGNNTLKVVSTDRAGNNFTVLRKINYINQGPEIIKFNPKSGVFGTLDNITVLIKDKGKGINLILSEITVKNLKTNENIFVTKLSSQNIGSNATITAKLPVLEDGNYSVKITTFSNDLSGTSGEGKQFVLRIIKGAPIIKILNPLPGLTTNHKTELFEVEVNSGNPPTLESLILTLNNKKFIMKKKFNEISRRTRIDSVSGVETYSLSDIPLEEGNNSYFFNATDQLTRLSVTDVNKVFRERKTRKILTSAKIIKAGANTGTSIVQDFNFSKPFPFLKGNIALVCSNLEGTSGEFRCNNNSIKWCFAQSECEPINIFFRPLILPDVQPGIGTLCFRSEDLIGNLEFKRCINIVKDNTPPVFEIIDIKGANTAQVNNTFFRTISTKINVTGTVNEEADVFVSIFINNRPKTFRANTTIINGKTMFIANLTLDTDSRNTFKAFPIIIRAADFGANIKDHDLILGFDNTPALINAVSPRPFTSNKEKPLIKINTTFPAACKLFQNIEGLPFSIIEQRDMNTTDNLIHTVQIEKPLPNANGLTKSSFIKFNCTDLLNGKTSTLTKTFVVDKENPTISRFDALMQGVEINSTANTKDYLMLSGLLASLRVNASEPIRCRFSENTINFEKMEHNFRDFNSFSKSAESELISNFNDRENATFFIACQDAAGNNASLRTINIETRLNAPIGIFDAQPKRFVNTLSPKVKAKTAFNIDCFVSSKSTGLLFVFDTIKHFFGSKTGAKMQKDSLNSLFQHSGELSSLSGNSQGKFEEGKNYSLRIRCEDPRKLFSENSVNLTFTPDVTTPIIKSFLPDKNFETSSSLLNITGKTEKFATLLVLQDNKEVTIMFLNNTENFQALISLKNGTNIIKIISTDRAGNQFVITRTINFTNKGPSIITMTPNSGVYDKLENITAILKPLQPGIDTVLTSIKIIKLNSTSSHQGQEISGIKKIFLKNNTIIVAKLPELDNGDYVAILKTFSNDISSTPGESSIIHFTITKDAPKIKVINPEDRIKTNKQAPAFQIEITPKVPNILKSVNLNLNNQTFVIKRNKNDVSRRIRVDNITGKETYELTNQNLAPGNNSYFITATDEFAKSSRSETRKIELDINALIAEVEVQQPPQAEKFIEHKCELAPGIECEQVDTNLRIIKMKLKNQLSFDLKRGTIITVCGTDFTLNTPVPIGKTVNISITCAKDVTFESESKLSISFRDGADTQQVEGKIVTNVKRPTVSYS